MPSTNKFVFTSMVGASVGVGNALDAVRTGLLGRSVCGQGLEAAGLEGRSMLDAGVVQTTA